MVSEVLTVYRFKTDVSVALYSLKSKRLFLRVQNILEFISHPKELFSGARVQSPVRDLGLFSQVFCTFNGRHHPLDCQESSQICSVGGDDDQSEEPPDATDNTPRQRPSAETNPEIYSVFIIQHCYNTQLVERIRSAT